MMIDYELCAKFSKIKSSAGEISKIILQEILKKEEKQYLIKIIFSTLKKFIQF